MNSGATFIQTTRVPWGGEFRSESEGVRLRGEDLSPPPPTGPVASASHSGVRPDVESRFVNAKGRRASPPSTAKNCSRWSAVHFKDGVRVEREDAQVTVLAKKRLLVMKKEKHWKAAA